MNTISDIISSGYMNEIVQFLENKNLLNSNIFRFEDIYWLLKNKECYYKLIEIFRIKGIYDNIVW